MLNIYYGRESADKEKYMYDTIKDRGFSADSPVIVLVPDQYTIEAERRAFEVIGKRAMIGLDIYSVSRLRQNTLSKTGKGGITFIDKYGRQMLLTRVMNEIGGDLQVFSGSGKRASFIEMVNDLISEFKQYGVTPEALREMAAEYGGNDALSLKLADLSKIYTAYDAMIKGKYTDSEDEVDLFVDRIGDAGLFRDTAVWVYGFDSFAPKSLKVLGALMEHAKEVNVILTYDENCPDSDLFTLTGTVMNALRAEAKERGVSIGKVSALRAASGAVGEGGADAGAEDRCPARKTVPEIAHIERGLYSVTPEPFDGTPEHIKIVRAANYHNEAESAAAHILHLVRDKGYRYRDIAVICNDQTVLAPMLERAFDEYGLPVFRDRKRNIADSNVSVYLLSLLAAVRYGYRREDIFRALKTGLSPIEKDDIELLEEYAVEYRIDGNRWKTTFRYGKTEYGDQWEHIRELRKTVMGMFRKLENLAKKSGSYAGFVHGFLGYMNEELRLPDMLASIVKAQEAAGLLDLADETRQIRDTIGGILRQIDALMGDEHFDFDMFLQTFAIGLKQEEVGVLPSTPDDLIVGTMQRTRPGNVKALVVVGANEGVIPEAPSGNGIFAGDELDHLAEGGHPILKVDDVRRQEEALAIYRDLSRPSEELWIGYSASDEAGGALMKSELVEDLSALFGGLKEEDDVLNSGKPEDRIGGRMSTLRHLTEAMTDPEKNEGDEAVWSAVYDWYRENDPDELSRIAGGVGFENRPDELPPELAELMFSRYDGKKLVSASRLESYAGCPFKYFIESGLRAEERKIFEVETSDQGTVYHESLMKITGRLSAEGIWGSVTEEELDRMVDETLKQETEEYGDRLFTYSGSEAYRAGRMKESLREALRILVKHARAGEIRESRYEQPFGRKGLPPVEVKTDKGTVYIEGVIDRYDVLGNGRVKVIDYKLSGKPISENYIKEGYRLQLMVYMKAVRSEERKPAGVFYYVIPDDTVDLDKKSGVSMKALMEDTEESAAQKQIVLDTLADDAAMDGIVIDDPETLREIAGDGSGKVIKARFKDDGTPYKNNAAMVVSDEEFDRIQGEADAKIREIVENIQSGKIDIGPMLLSNKVSACTYCGYRGICRFDQAFRGCRYREVRK